MNVVISERLFKEFINTIRLSNLKPKTRFRFSRYDVSKHVTKLRHCDEKKKVTITIPPIAGPFLAIPAKPYLNSCCQMTISSKLFKYIT